MYASQCLLSTFQTRNMVHHGPFVFPLAICSGHFGAQVRHIKDQYFEFLSFGFHVHCTAIAVQQGFHVAAARRANCKGTLASHIAKGRRGSSNWDTEQSWQSHEATATLITDDTDIKSRESDRSQASKKAGSGAIASNSWRNSDLISRQKHSSTDSASSSSK